MKVEVFVTCLVDQIFPQVGMATMRLLERLDLEAHFNPAQTCCGQPAFNSGFRREAREVARHCLEVLEEGLASADYVVVPSGSCAAMIKKTYPELLADDPELKRRAESVGARTFELSQFLSEVFGVDKVDQVEASFAGQVTYHDSCHLLRELGVSDAPRKLISTVRGLALLEMEGANVCCGFGGTFSMKHPEIADAIAQDKVASIERTGAQAVVACDMGCLMHIDKLLSRSGSSVRCLHITELLAGAPKA